jgi:hypothetical protein
MSYLLSCAADIEMLLESFDMVNIPLILECCRTGRKGIVYRLLGPEKVISTFQK